MRKLSLVLGLVAGLLPALASAQGAQLVYPQVATYVASVAAQANTAAAHAIVIEAGASKAVRVLKVCVTNPGTQTTPGFRALLLERTTTAGDNAAITAEAAGATTAALAKSHSSAAAFSGIVRAKPTTPGTQGATLAILPIWVPSSAAYAQPVCLDFQGMYDRPIRVPKGVANGIALRDPGATGAAGFAAYIVFAEE